MSNFNPLKIPVTVKEKFVEAIEKYKFGDATSYRSLIGSFLFLATYTPLDIFHGVNILSRFMNKPTEAHLERAKRILRHLHGTQNSELSI